MSVFIIAEAGVNHNGEIKLAKQLVDMAVSCGADAVKFQTFRAEECVNVQADKVGYQKENDHTQETQYEMLKRLELSYEDFKELKRYCEEKKILFLSTPFGNEALEFLMSLDMPLIKLSSTEVTNHPYLKKVAKYNKPIILSTGMSYLEEVEEALKVMKETGNDHITLLHCTTNYPTALEEVNIQAIKTMKEAFGVEIGYSDHTEDALSAIAAITLGATIIEKHITINRDMAGPDHRASMDEMLFKKYISDIRKAEVIQGDGVKQPTKVEEFMRQMVRRSIVAKYAMPKNTVITPDHLEYKRPGTGLSPKDIGQIIGKKTRQDIKVDQMILVEDIGDEV